MPCQKTSFVMLAVWCTLFHILPKNQNLFKFHLKYGFYHTMLVTFSANSIVFFLLSLGLDMKQKSQTFHLLIKVTMIQVDKRYNYKFKGRYFFINSPKAFGEFQTLLSPPPPPPSSSPHSICIPFSLLFAIPQKFLLPLGSLSFYFAMFSILSALPVVILVSMVKMF